MEKYSWCSKKSFSNTNCIFPYTDDIYFLILKYINPLNTELYPICHLLTLLGAHHILHVSRIRVN